MTLGAVGDVLMHGAVKDAAADHRAPGNDDGYGWLWAPVADLLALPIRGGVTDRTRTCG